MSKHVFPIVDQLEREGWRPEFNGIDKDIVDESPCEKCSGKCHYKGLQTAGAYGEHRYRAFSLCDNCGNELEF